MPRRNPSPAEQRADSIAALEEAASSGCIQSSYLLEHIYAEEAEASARLAGPVRDGRSRVRGVIGKRQ